MIERVSISNYRCLRSVTIDLEPLTVLVGPNASGKSAVLDALGWHHIGPRDRWRHEVAAIQIATRGPGEAQWTAQVPSGQEKTIKRSYQPQLVRLDLAILRAPNTAENVARMATDGHNLTNVFAGLGRAVASLLSRLVPAISDVDVVPHSNGKLILRFRDRWDEGVWYEPKEVSDGTMLILAMLVILHQSPPVDLLLIEEPERGVHPFLLGQLIGLLRQVSAGELVSRPVQVLMATHSAEVLDHVQPEEVRFLKRDPDDGSTLVSAAPLDDPGWAAAYDEYQRSLGLAWLSGGLGGVPG